MKITPWGCCVVVFDCSGEPVVRPKKTGLPRTDVSGSECEVDLSTSEEEVEKKKERKTKRLFTAILKSWLPCILPCRFSSDQWLIFRDFVGDAESAPGTPRNEDVSTGVETDGQLKRHIVVTKILVPLAGGPQHDVVEAVHSQNRSRELSEQTFDDGNICVQMRNLLVLFLVHSNFSSHLSLLDQFVTNPAATVIRATAHQMVSFCHSVCEEGKAKLLSPIMNS